MFMEGQSQRGPEHDRLRMRNLVQAGLMMRYAEDMKKRGIEMTQDEAAMEWIARYASAFGGAFDNPSEWKKVEALKDPSALQAYLNERAGYLETLRARTSDPREQLALERLSLEELKARATTS